ncbi:PREDICTED: uncharacterized protein LOC109582151 [Amphimedon queenslandica]|uniref:Fibronectin type-III domain-containing protein n=2 Tax=Amphimedon queenslandica TaxID=400682 RepID=A0AAN0J5Q6_AMPQE|nr:PREDICTED: uncharacterized protein LOC109582151 [Amphimedon queenslandica]|eukprot:XP_019852344.1 PREDICTED: uncharacterized protein LOC109582151 [Amphimedon queenslandica]
MNILQTKMVVMSVACNLGVLLLSLLLFCCTSACPHTDDHVSYMHDITTCNGSDAVISFNITGVANCSNIHADYFVYIYYHFPAPTTHEKLPDPIFHNETGLCQVFLTLYNVTYEDFVDAILQVRILTPPLNNPHFNCSNNFSLIFITDPPSPVSTLDSHINCSGVFISWPKPYASTSCPVLHYIIILNKQTDVITPYSFFKYSWSELSHNTLYTVSIVAVTGAGYSIESNSTEFITALAPKVIMIDHDVPLLAEDAAVFVKAKVSCIHKYMYHSYCKIKGTARWYIGHVHLTAAS